MERYDIYLEGEKIRSDIDEEEMLDVTQELAEQFYRDGTPHPDDIEVKYLGTSEDYRPLFLCFQTVNCLLPFYWIIKTI